MAWMHLLSRLIAVVMMLIARHVSCLPSDVTLTTRKPQSCRPHSDMAIILDVDNTLYCEETLKRLTGQGIEEQIIANTHKFCKEHLDLSPDQAEDLFVKYGTIIEGIRQEYPDRSQELLNAFYHEVYDTVDFTCLQTAQRRQRAHMDDTGYSHAGDSLSALREFLSHIPFPIYLASNSPSWHVTSVLHGLGLTNLAFRGMLTPDLITHHESLSFPTKAHPSIYYRDVLQQHEKCILVDDSLHNIQRANDIGMQAIHVNHDSVSLEQALNIAIGHVSSNFTLSDVSYLKAKNVVDGQSIHAPTWNQVATNLVLDETGMLRVADVGAGVLSMLSLLLKGQDDKKALVSMMKVKGIEYFAYEPNTSLLEACCENLKRLGFQFQTRSETEVVYHRSNHNVTVHLRMTDFTNDDQSEEVNPNLIVGCCFADLMDPHVLVESLLRFTTGSTRNNDTLVYFPITFAGITQFVPPQPFGTRTVASRRTIPSDTTAFHLYSNALKTRHGHNLDPDKLVAAMNDYGATLIDRGPSNWKIDPTDNEYLWKTMLYFFGTVGASEMMKQGYDSVGWIDRARRQRPSIEVTNIDLLFRLGSSESVSGLMERAASNDFNEDHHHSSELEIQEIQFTAPYEVGTITKTVDRTDGAHLGPNQVEVRSVCSLISSGTELKIFKGLFDDAALDVNIDGMAEERMAYPLSYGYSLVGRVTRCGSNVEKDLLGRLVFTFSSHSSHVIVDRGAIQVVPDGIDAQDAIFMPSVETALSMAHDAHIHVGEKVAVFGQGLIGLLVTAILNSQALPGTVTTFEGIPQRLAASAAMGSSQALLPMEAESAGPFDVSIEVSGNAKALQSAIDNTRSGGRVIVGSWYGNADVNLKLGIDFHRSHKTIKTSQVSEIPAELTALWSKERRFALTWDLVRQLKPSRLITLQTTLTNAKGAYDALDQGKEISVCFTYP